MALMDAKEYDPRPAERRRKIIATVVVAVIAISVYLYLTRYDSEKKVINNFFQAIEQKDFDKAYGIYEGDPDWKQHPEKYRQLLCEPVQAGLGAARRVWRHHQPSD